MLKLKQKIKRLAKAGYNNICIHHHPAEAGGKEELAKSELNIFYAINIPD